MRIERGAVIADRYVVSAIERPWLADRPDAGVVCLALDAILDDPVILYAAAPELAGDLMDTGRRLALISDPRVPDVLDVGEGSTEDGEDVVYVVCSRTAATSLAEILSAGPIDATPTRAIAGEVSEVLVHAARRGLHHRCLGPESIGITRDGDVVVHGIAIDAALSELALDLAPQTDSTALREDALAVIDILYACLTGMWPKPESRAGLPAAPRKNTRVVDVETLRADLPEDLYSFITGVTSRTDPGPRSPGEIVRYLREWDRDSLMQLEGSPLPDEELFAEGAAGTASADGDASARAGAVDDAEANAPEGDREKASAAAASTPGTPAPDAGAAADGHRSETSSGSASSGDTVAGAGDASGAGETASTSAGSGSVGAKPTANTGRPRSTTGMGASGARPTAAAAPPRPAPAPAPSKRSASPAQIQAALARIGMTRPGVSGYSAGRADGVHTKLDEQMQMREASVFPLSPHQLAEAEMAEWDPEDTISEYSRLAEQEYDRNLTAPIMNREELFTENLETQQMPVVTEDMTVDSEADGTAPASAESGDREESADGSWFLGGMFTTREEELERQRTAFERERARERRLNEEARERALAAEQRRDRHRKATAAAAAAQAPRTADGDSHTGTGGEPQTKAAAGSETEAHPGDGTPSGAQGAAGSESAPTAHSNSAQDAAAPQDAPAAGGAAAQSTATSQNSSQAAPNAETVGTQKSAGRPKTQHSAQEQTSGTPDRPGAVRLAAGTGAGAAAAAGAGSPSDPAQNGGAPGGGAAAAPAAPQQPRRRRGAIVWTVIGAILLIGAVVFGIIAVRNLSSSSEPQPNPAPTAVPSQAPSPSEEPSAEPEGPAPAIDSVTDLDPEGDGSENPTAVDNILSDDDSQWQTDRYNSAAFGSLKSGLGLGFALEEEASVSSVTIDSPDQGSTVEIRVGDSDDPEDAETVGEARLDGGSTTVELDEPQTAEYVFVWYTELAPAGEGYRGQITHVEID